MISSLNLINMHVMQCMSTSYVDQPRNKWYSAFMASWTKGFSWRAQPHQPSWDKRLHGNALV